MRTSAALKLETRFESPPKGLRWHAELFIGRFLVMCLGRRPESAILNIASGEGYVRNAGSR